MPFPNLIFQLRQEGDAPNCRGALHSDPPEHLRMFPQNFFVLYAKTVKTPQQKFENFLQFSGNLHILHPRWSINPKKIENFLKFALPFEQNLKGPPSSPGGVPELESARDPKYLSARDPGINPSQLKMTSGER